MEELAEGVGVFDFDLDGKGIADPGFDASWPERPESAEAFARKVAETVARKGHCVLHAPLDEEEREDALIAAGLWEKLKGCEEFKGEAEEAWLGEENQTKVCRLGEDVPETELSNALLRCDRRLTHLALGLEPLAATVMGFECWGRTNALVRMGDPEHFSDWLEESDLEQGAVQRLVEFVRTRRLSILYIVEAAGGELDLRPRDGLGLQRATIAVTRDKIVLFRHDLMTYQFRPRGPSLALQSWLLETPLALALAQGEEPRFVGSTRQSAEEVMGLSGPSPPPGDVAQVLAVSVRLPGGSLAPGCCWAMYTSGSETQTEVSPLRWDWTVYYSPEADAAAKGRTNAKHAGFLPEEDLEYFDSSFFGLSTSEVRVMAPEQRLVAETGHGALRAAGFSKESLHGANIGVYTGDCAGEFSNYCREICDHRLTGAGGANAATAARLSHLLGMRGATCAFDTACSSSLVALGYAHNALRTSARQAQVGTKGHSASLGALVIGVRVLFGPDAFIGLGAGGFLGPHGRCLTFDGSANGFGRGEGCSAVFIGTSGGDGADEELRLACLAGTCVNQDGRSASMTAPHGPSQQECIKHSLAMGRILPGTISIAECHGTGTSLGDPIEVGALRGVLHGHELPLLMTSAKTNIGHAESAAGLNGLVKCVMMMVHAMAPPNVHLRSLNAHLDVDGFPCLVEKEPTDCGRNSQHVGVSSFGFGGTNARADLWGICKAGPRAVGPLAAERCDIIQVSCPRCHGPMCWVCSAAVPNYALDSPHYCTLVREDFASYKHCSVCYEGSYKCGRPILDTLNMGRRVFAVGSWSSWATMHELEQTAPDTYVCGIIVGETLYERFRLVLDRDPDQALYPIHDQSGPMARILGPDSDGRDKAWLLDGKRDRKHSGTVYRLTFTWSPQTGAKKLRWEATTATVPRRIDSREYKHEYFIMGSWNGWGFQRMEPAARKLGVHETSFRVGPTGEEVFQFARDADYAQVIFPGAARTEEESVLVQGPDFTGTDKNWLVRASRGQTFRVQLRVVEGHITVTLNPGERGSKMWQSAR